jgi:hypothetical protein
MRNATLLETHSKNLKYISDQKDELSLKQQECDKLYLKLEKQEREQNELQTFNVLEAERINQMSSDLNDREYRFEREKASADSEIEEQKSSLAQDIKGKKNLLI